MKIITKRPNGTIRVATQFPDETKTDQSFKDECDVNNIIAKFKKTGQLTHLAKRPGVYADISEITDLLDMTNKVKEAQDAFDALPSQLRKKLDNDPAKFIDYVNDPKNNEELVSFGIKIARPQYSEVSKPDAVDPSSSLSQSSKSKKQQASTTTTINDDDDKPAKKS